MNWEHFTVEEIRSEVDEQSGERLLVLFSNDYSLAFGESPCVSCPGGLTRSRQKLINNKTMNDFKVKAKYEGVPFGFGSKKHLSNELLNNAEDEKDVEALVFDFVSKKNEVRQKDHPGESLIDTGEVFFEKLPASEELERIFAESEKEPLILSIKSGGKLKFVELLEGDEITEGAKAKIGNKNAKGEVELEDGRTFVFENGLFLEEKVQE